MGSCLGTNRKSTGHTLDPSSSSNTRNTASVPANSESDREARAAAAEIRLKNLASKGVQDGGGKLTKQLEEQKNIGPGRIPIEAKPQEQIVYD